MSFTISERGCLGLDFMYRRSLQLAAAWQGSGCRLTSGPGDRVEFRYSEFQIAVNSAETTDFLQHQFGDPEKAFFSLQYGTAFTPTNPS